ncbi:hypothetical protein LZ016_13765 [Sphingomonas sp. SM33]|uniref:Secreted protein n=1 Tax=Sphingomonas telluris TaxID=2907998 RepID=A0ABS9VQA2_9SPHN|nr:hypothetical protein [Sphingomonas telluris]MCH8617160.1 hypothetical protein [Sphingomonas telluris]
MRVRFPEPPNGWQAFAFEFVTIVLGVLVALGAQELVQSVHWRTEVRTTRKALDAELARNRAVFDYRFGQRACVGARLSELRRWATDLRESKSVPLKHEIEEPPFFATRTAAWEITDGEIAARIPLDAKLNYAAFYDGIRRYDQMRNDEAEAWAKLGEFESSTRLNEEDYREVKRALDDIEDVNTSIMAFRAPFDRFSRALNISPDESLEIGNPLVKQWNDDFCRPL